MKAYAILDGGGVKGAALAGALHAADQLRVEWLGFGGTSAGAIVAILMSVGYTPAELRGIVVDRPFTDVLDDEDGSELEQVKIAIGEIVSAASNGWMIRRAWTLRSCWKKHQHLISRLTSDLGIYSGDRLRSWLLAKIQAKLPALQGRNDITFRNLTDAGAKPLKIVAADISYKRAVIYPDDAGDNKSVLDAVRASVCFPFAFKPVRQDPSRLLDGGLCSNLPAFLFGDEARRTRVPVIAIDLVPKVDAVTTPPTGVRQFAADMLDTILEGSDKLLRDRLRNLHHVNVEIDPPVSAMDFQISQQRRQQLFQNGVAAFHGYYAANLRPLEAAAGTVAKVQAAYASPDLVEPILEYLVRTVEAGTNAERVRAHVTLPTVRNTRVVAYQWGMDGMPDRTLEMGVDSGCSGAAYIGNTATYADMVEAARNLGEWKMTQEQQDRIPPDLRAMISVPLRDTSDVPVSSSEHGLNLTELPVIGTLSIDTITEGETAGWITVDGGEVSISGEVLDFLSRWADIIAKVLT